MVALRLVLGKISPNGIESATGFFVALSRTPRFAGAKVIVLVTRWAEFSQLAGLLKELGRSPLVVDGRRVLDPGSFAHYEGIGR